MTPKQKYKYRKAKKGEYGCSTCAEKQVQLSGQFALLGAKCEALAYEENSSKGYQPRSYVNEKICGVKAGMICNEYTPCPSLLDSEACQ